MSLYIDLLTRSSDNGTYAAIKQNIVEYIKANKSKPQKTQPVIQQTHSPLMRIVPTIDIFSIQSLTDKSIVATKF